MPKRILIVEDDPVNRTMMADVLSANGYDVVCASNGVEGVQRFQADRPDLMIVDALLPLKSGFEVCFDVRREAATRGVPLLMMSAVCRDAHAADHARADLGVAGYLVKPFRMHELVRGVESLVGAPRGA